MSMDDQIIAVPVGDRANEFHGIVKFNSTAAEIIRLIQEGKDEKGIVENILKEYDTSRDEAEKTVETFIAQLKEKGLLM